MMFLHAGSPLAPHDVVRAWSFESGVILPLVITAAVYAKGAKESLARAKRSKGTMKGEVIVFSCGLIVLTLALVSPIHSAGGALFSAHMIQHELLMAIAAPLLVLGKPAVPLIWGLPVSMRPYVGRLF
jgi:cytochrome c oxidase assembly factor CtaG